MLVNRDGFIVPEDLNPDILKVLFEYHKTGERAYIAWYFPWLDKKWEAVEAYISKLDCSHCYEKFFNSDGNAPVGFPAWKVNYNSTPFHLRYPECISVIIPTSKKRIKKQSLFYINPDAPHSEWCLNRLKEFVNLNPDAPTQLRQKYANQT